MTGNQQADSAVYRPNKLARCWSSPSFCTRGHVQCTLLAPFQNHSRRGAVNVDRRFSEVMFHRIIEHMNIFGESVVGTVDGVRHCTRHHGVSVLDRKVVDKLNEAEIDFSQAVTGGVEQVGAQSLER